MLLESILKAAEHIIINNGYPTLFLIIFLYSFSAVSFPAVIIAVIKRKRQQRQRKQYAIFSDTVSAHYGSKSGRMMPESKSFSMSRNGSGKSYNQILKELKETL